MLYQLSYASGAVARERASAKIGASRCSVKGRSQKAKRQPREERKVFPSRVPWLPLPEKTGSDRDEPHCLHGFVDRAYLVFCVELRTTTTASRTAQYRPEFLSPPSSLAADSFGDRGGVRAPGDPSPTPYVRFSGCGATRAAGERRRRCRFALAPALVFRPLPLEGLPRSLAGRRACVPVSEAAALHGSCHPAMPWALLRERGVTA